MLNNVIYGYFRNFKVNLEILEPYLCMYNTIKSRPIAILQGIMVFHYAVALDLLWPSEVHS